LSIVKGIYRKRPGFFAVVLFGSSPLPLPSASSDNLCRPTQREDRLRDGTGSELHSDVTAEERGGDGLESCDGKKSVGLLIYSLSVVITFLFVSGPWLISTERRTCKPTSVCLNSLLLRQFIYDYYIISHDNNTT
jgi:hypothetical protein